MKPTDIRICGVEHTFKSYRYRTPIKFGGVALDKVTLLNVRVRVRNRAGVEADGFGSMPLGNVWSFPSRVLGYDRTLQAMKGVAERVERIIADCAEFADPIEINWQLEPEYLRAAVEVGKELELGVPIPKLCTLVVASAFDAAIHDGFGKAAGINCYHAYSSRHITHDLGRYLDDRFRGEYPDKYVLAEPKPWMHLYHLVGALDPIFDADIKDRVGDGLPETLGEWVLAEGLRHIKIKLNGDDLGWDVQRLIAVERAVSAAQEQRRNESWYYSLDFNERCADTSYLLEFLRRANKHSSAMFDRVQYIEQPTARDLTRAQPVHEAAKIKPVVIDESLVDYESLLLARQLGYRALP